MSYSSRTLKVFDMNQELTRVRCTVIAKEADDEIAMLRSEIADLKRNAEDMRTCIKLCVEIRNGLRTKCDEMNARIRELTEWRPVETAPKDRAFIGDVDHKSRVCKWGKASHVPLRGFCLADQGPEDFDLCMPTGWLPIPGSEAP